MTEAIESSLKGDILMTSSGSLHSSKEFEAQFQFSLSPKDTDPELARELERRIGEPLLTNAVSGMIFQEFVFEIVITIPQVIRLLGFDALAS
jgi:hypothetical protein